MRTHPATRLFGRPILLAPDGAAALQIELSRDEGGRPGLLGRILGARSPAPAPAKAEAPRIPDALTGRKCEMRDGYILADGVAVIRLDGIIYSEGGCSDDWYGSYRWAGYDDLRRVASAAAADDAVRGIFLRINSPGGEVVGMAEAATMLAGLPKPVAAHVAGVGHSAAYALGCSAAPGRLTCGEACTVGSIGALMIHTDTSKADERWGIKVTPIQFGEGKSDGQPFQPLSPEGLGNFQTQIDEIGQRFVAWVAQRRNLEPAAVLATKARTKMDRDALALGLVDAVLTEAEAFAAFADALSASSAGAPAQPTATRPASAQTAAITEETMGLKQQIEAALGRLAKGGQPKAMAATADEIVASIREILDAADDGEEEASDGAGASTDEGASDPAAMDGEEDPEADKSVKASTAKPGTGAYVLAITGLPEAQGREQAARQLASTGKLSVAEAKAVLATLPKKGAFAPQNPSIGHSPAGGARDQKAVAASWDAALKSARVARKV